MSLLSDIQKQKLRRVFVGPDGIRAGWSALIFAAIFAALAVVLNLVIHAIYHPPKSTTGEMSVLNTYIGQAVAVCLVMVATWVMSRIEKKSFGVFGLGGSRRLSDFLIGALVGFICLSLLVGVLYQSGYLAFDGVALQGAAIVAYAVLWFGAFFLVAVSEETIFRGYLLNTLTRGIGLWPAMIALAALFTLAHMGNDGENAFGLIAVFTAGLFLCLLRQWSGSLWLGIGFHAAWDWSQSYLYGTPDSGQLVQNHLLLTHASGATTYSGGSVGPEGSIFAQPILLGGIVIMLLIVRRYRSVKSLAAV
jgi:membrane protease YdiL (CAAX protease family)